MSAAGVGVGVAGVTDGINVEAVALPVMDPGCVREEDAVASDALELESEADGDASILTFSVFSSTGAAASASTETSILVGRVGSRREEVESVAVAGGAGDAGDEDGRVAGAGVMGEGPKLAGTKSEVGADVGV